MERSIAIAEIAGRDSVAAAVAAVREHGFETVLPTIGYTGTEVGDKEAPYRAVERLRSALPPHVRVLDPVPLADPALWSAMNALPMAEVLARYGVCSPCLACHLYLHLLRVPLAWSHGNAPVISGERDTHDGRIKLSQTAASIDAATRVLSYAGVPLLSPLRSMSGEQIEALTGTDWRQGERQMGCQLSGNYLRLDGSVSYDEAGYARYLAEFFEPVGRAVVDAFRAEREGGEASDFAAVVRTVLER
ncbi:hypothetical protein MX659_01475 [Coriobacteriia bacterium Es71-Z0120]|uniref:hypothetical protein n=1 Tax=Parvivirga hydrogeniphila TaxID=2939460 RepID=UPI002260BDCD|nr:hypothetical protein [Parvivirga hydrogeniphila]MCL4078281.1 hypothetical protein [Parvivirga hydrogeniphila]